LRQARPHRLSLATRTCAAGGQSHNKGLPSGGPFHLLLRIASLPLHCRIRNVMTTTTDVGQMAKSKAQLQLDSIAVIGLFTGPQGDSALLRMRDGAIQKVAAGDKAAGLTVLAIDDAAVTLRDNRGQTFRLGLPGDA
jgi:hypothetical protein